VKLKLKSRHSASPSLLVVLFLAFCPIRYCISQQSDEIEELLLRHESQLTALESCECEWSVDFSLKDEKAEESNIQKYHTVVAPGYERTARTGVGIRREDIMWDGQFFYLMRGLVDDLDSRPAYVEAMKGMRLSESYPILRPFNWWSMRRYRCATGDPDQTLRELCESSPTKPRLSEEGELLKITLTFRGSLMPGSTTPVCRNSVVNLYLDPNIGYLIRKYTTQCDDRLMEITMETMKTTEHSPGVHLPTAVEMRIKAGTDLSVTSAIFTYQKTNEPIDTTAPFFVENLLVRDAPHFDAEASQFFVVGSDGTLGPPLRSEAEAATVRFQRLGLAIRTHEGAVATSRTMAYWILGFVTVAALLVFYSWRRR